MVVRVQGLRAELPGHLGAARLARAEARRCRTGAARTSRARSRPSAPGVTGWTRRASGWWSTPGSRPSRTSSRAAARRSVSPGYHVLGRAPARRGGRAGGRPGRQPGRPCPRAWVSPEAAAPLLVGLTAWRMLDPPGRPAGRASPSWSSAPAAG
ncbi:MAG: hypothetical protein MZV70_68120 [Desulfobacterales bacterium]|nr:hypothetical protein [Desulfobacterales bacterium]